MRRPSLGSPPNCTRPDGATTFGSWFPTTDAWRPPKRNVWASFRTNAATQGAVATLTLAWPCSRGLSRRNVPMAESRQLRVWVFGISVCFVWDLEFGILQPTRTPNPEPGHHDGVTSNTW